MKLLQNEDFTDPAFKEELFNFSIKHAPPSQVTTKYIDLLFCYTSFSAPTAYYITSSILTQENIVSPLYNYVF